MCFTSNKIASQQTCNAVMITYYLVFFPIHLEYRDGPFSVNLISWGVFPHTFGLWGLETQIRSKKDASCSLSIKHSTIIGRDNCLKSCTGIRLDLTQHGSTCHTSRQQVLHPLLHPVGRMNFLWLSHWPS